jgi:probable phosphoglycerate mutase
MTQIVLIRPGSTDYDEQGRIAGVLDIPLCHNGAGQVARLVDEIKQQPIALVYTAPDRASQQTAEAVATAGDLKIKKIEALRNLNLGLWQGLLIDDVRQKQRRVYKQWQESPETICPPEGETLAEANQRIVPALQKILRKHRDAMVALIVPEPLCSVVRSRLTHGEIGDLWAADSVCGSWELIDTLAAAKAS